MLYLACKLKQYCCVSIRRKKRYKPDPFQNHRKVQLEAKSLFHNLILGRKLAIKNILNNYPNLLDNKINYLAKHKSGTECFVDSSLWHSSNVCLIH